MNQTKSSLRERFTPAAKSSFINYGIILLFFAIVQPLIVTKHISNNFKGQLIPICAYICMALALNLVVGISGELSLGHAGFMSVGAFSGVVTATALTGTITNVPLRLAVAILVGAIAAAIFGAIIGIVVLRLKGDYLAIVTLAFGEIIKNILNCLYIGLDGAGLHFSFSDPNAGVDIMNGGTVILNGPMGALGIKKISSFTSGIVLVLIVLFIIQNLINSRSGRAIKAIRDNRIAAEACGLNVFKYKMMAFVLSAAIAGAAGVLYALNYSTIVPKKFDFNTSILVLVFVVLGGIGNLRGSIIAAGVLTVLPELLRAFNSYRMLIYAVVLILVMLATNNAQIKSLLSKIVPKKKASGKETKT